MKAYLVTTGTLFGLLALLHFVRTIAEWPRVTTDPWFFLGTAGIGALAAALLVWAWHLLGRQFRS